MIEFSYLPETRLLLTAGMVAALRCLAGYWLAKGRAAGLRGGLLVCSDGIETFHRDPEAAARLFRRKGIPIHTLTVGTTNDTRDIILENVRARRAVPNQAPTKLILTMRAPGYENQTVPIQVRQK